MIDLSTEKLTGWDYHRGNVTETVFDKYKFAELIINECIDVIDNKSLAEKIINHFNNNGESNESTQASIPLGW